MTVTINPERGADPDHLVNLIPQPNLDVLALAQNPDIRLTQFTKKVQRRSSLLAQRQLQSVLPAPLLDRLLHVGNNPVKPIRRTGAVNALVRTLMVVVVDPVVETLAGVGKRSEHRILQKFRPDRLPEPLDLAQGHGMVGSKGQSEQE